MDLETRRRIRAYKKALPELRERVVAVALLLAMSASMLVSASFAWLTLSRNPEVSAISTTVTANGNLEIALAQGDGKTAPGESQVGDSSAKQSVLEANKTWGNLINLNDASYGLDYMELRPAKLNDASLANSPLWGSVYAEDGRITTLDSRYTYTMWNPTGKEFMATKDYGVRAIASYTTGTSGEQTAVYDAIVMQTVNAHNAANNAYKESLRDEKIGSLSTLMSNYVQIQADQMLGGGADADVEVKQSDISKMHSLYSGYLGAVKLAAQAKVELANLQQYIYATNHEGDSYTPVTWEDLVANQNLFDSKGSGHKTNPTNAREAISLTGLKQFITDYNTMASDFAAIEDYKNNYAAYGTIYFNSGGKAGKNIGDMVSRLVDPASAQIINGNEVITIGNLGKSQVMGLLGLSSAPVVVNKGVLVRIEQNIADPSYRVGRGEAGYKGEVKISVKALGMTKNVTGYVTTAADGVSHFSADFAKATEMDLSGSEKIAEDTYGLAIDFWVRTNAAQTYLTLEGKLDKTTEQVRVTGTDGSGNQVPLYTVIVTRSGREFEADVYSQDSKWYYAGTNTEVTAAEMGENTPTPKNREITTVHGYSGENRVWENAENDALLTAESTTQGNGSCYIYYADTPEDMEHSLDLLNAMKVAFISGPDLLATASMDTEHYYAVNGRVTVPMKLDALSGVNTGTEDEEGNPVYGIAPLVQNEARMITALVYLDGTMLGNDNVLAASTIGGQLNIQFGSSQPLTTVGDENLKDDIRTVRASVTEKEFKYEDLLLGRKLTTDVTVNVDGDNPNQVTAFFQRAINATQGTRQETMTFTKQEDGSWHTTYDFKAPGDYYLRTVRLDGIDYPLAEPCQVTVDGFALSSVTWGETSDQATKYMVESYYDESVSVAFAASESFAQPKTVQARFIKEDGNALNIDLKFNATTQRWEGTGRFTASGTYQLRFLLVDGEYYDTSAFTKTLTLYMGLTTRVENAGSTLQEDYETGKVYPKEVNVYIYDNAGNMLENLMGVTLYYTRGGDVTLARGSSLEWDGSAYHGTLLLQDPGRYTFVALQTGSSTLTKATESPVYIIRNPEMPKYHGGQSEDPQCAPACDAIIGPVKISNAIAVEAIVHNSITNLDYKITQDSIRETEESGSWIMELPFYYLDSDLDENGNPRQGAKKQQAGTWTVKEIHILECFDENLNYYDSDHPLVWSYNFEKLATTVSTSVKVTMNEGRTTLGDTDTAFMTAHNVAALGFNVQVTDNDDNVIPGEKISSVVLNMSYNGNQNMDYGYEVSQGANSTYALNLTYNDAKWEYIVKEGETPLIWKYVGEYKVDSVVVNLATTETEGVTKSVTYYPGTVYKIKSKAPTVDNLWPTVTQRFDTFGIDSNGNKVGQFLDSYNPEVSVGLTVKDANGGDASYARVAGAKVSVIMDHLEGSNEDCGYICTTGESQYETITLIDGTSDGKYQSITTPMLPGKYLVTGSVTVDNDPNKTKELEGLRSITVHSMKPTVKVTGINPGDGQEFDMIANAVTSTTSKEQRLWPADDVHKVRNYISDSGDYANVYIKAEPYDNGNNGVTVNYTAPEVTLTLSNAGNFKTAELVVPNSANTAYNSEYRFDSNNQAKTAMIGGVNEASDGSDGFIGLGNTKYYYDEKYEAGQQEIKQITMTVDKKNSTGTETYKIDLATPVTIRQENTIPPSISFVVEDGYTKPADVTSETGVKFTYRLPLAAEIGTFETTIEDTTAEEWEKQNDESRTTYCYVEKSTKNEEKEWSWSSFKYITYYKYVFVFRLYDWVEERYTQEAEFTTYNTVYKLKCWSINGVEYQPGETITVDDAFTATAIIEEDQDSRTRISSETKTAVKIVQYYEEHNPKTVEGTGGRSTNNETAAEEYYKVKPADCQWFNASSPKTAPTQELLNKRVETITESTS